MLLGFVSSGFYTCAFWVSCVCISGFGFPASLISRQRFLFMVCFSVLLCLFLCLVVTAVANLPPVAGLCKHISGFVGFWVLVFVFLAAAVLFGF